MVLIMIQLATGGLLYVMTKQVNINQLAISAVIMGVCSGLGLAWPDLENFRQGLNL